MKRISFFSTPFYMFLTEIPFVAILVLSIIYNQYAEGWTKLYPLITVMAAAIVFSNIFLFRAVMISRAEVRDIGRFSPRDRADLLAGGSIRLQPMDHGKVKIYVYGKAGLPELDWMRDQTTNPDEICMYRGRTQGGLRTVGRILSHFGVPSAEVERILSGGEFSGDYTDCTVKVLKLDDGKIEYRIGILSTIREFNTESIELSSGCSITSKRLSDGEWETEIHCNGEHISTHRSKKVKKQLTKILSEYEATASDLRELFGGGDTQIDLDLVFASAKDGAYTVRIK